MSDDECEEWRVSPDFPDYAVSSYGRVKCLTRRRYNKIGDLLPLHTLKNGYVVAHLDGRNRLVNRLVCVAFHGAPPTPRHDAAHNNGRQSENYFKNLRWATRKENCADKKIHGTENPPRGERHGRAKLTRANVSEIIRLWRSGLLQREIAVRFGVARTTVSAITNGYNWRHV